VIVTSRKVSDDIGQGGHREGKYFLIDGNAKPYVDRAIFEHFIRHDFIPHITALRTIPCYCKAEAVLLMGNCCTYAPPEIFRFLRENHIRIVAFASHTTNIFRALNLSFFGVFKTKEKFWMDQDDDKTLTAMIHAVVRQRHSATTSDNIRESFVRAEFSYDTGPATFVLEFLKERMMENARFRRVWELDVPLESLSMCIQNAQLGFVNEENFQPFGRTESAFYRGIMRKICSSFCHVLSPFRLIRCRVGITFLIQK
jgi:hypothetical protein